MFGGSQGALAINRCFCASIASLNIGPFQVLHFAGKKDVLDKIQKRYPDLNIRACVKEFEDKIPIALQAASLAICRAGAATLAELIAFEVPAVLIPFPHATETTRPAAENLSKRSAARCASRKRTSIRPP